MAKRLSFTERLTVGFAGTVLLAILIAVAAIQAIVSMARGREALADSYGVQLISAERLRLRVEQRVSLNRSMLLTGDLGVQEQVESASGAIAAEISALRAPERSDEFAFIDDIDRADQQYADQQRRVFAQLRGGGTAEQVRREWQQRLGPARGRLSAALDRYVQHLEGELTAAANDARQSEARALQRVIAVTLGALVLAAIVGLLLTRTLARLWRAKLHESAEAEASRERYADLVDGLSGAVVWESDARTGQMLFVSRQAGALLGHPAERWLKTPGFLVDLVPLDERERVERALEAAAAGRGDQTVEHRLVAQGGRTLWFQTRIHGASRPAGAARLLRGLSVDISRLREAEEAMRAHASRQAALAHENALLYRQAQEAVRARDDFLSVASHELKTPLTSFQLQAQALLRAAHRADGRSVPLGLLSPRLEMLQRQSERLGQLINNLLDISRITAGRLQLQSEPVDLTALVGEVVRRMRVALEHSGCVVRLQLSQAVSGRWDRLRLEQVVTNLLSNAAKYGAGRPIDVLVDAEEGQARLVVRDRGIGIAAEDRARIFERFERAVSTSHYGGFGLGLWIVRQIVMALGGDIEVESEPGQGSTFTVHLPSAQVAAEPPELQRLGDGADQPAAE